ncbi:MAG TPA: DUF3572 domain-containing protein [Microvirga sp.]
MNTYRKITKDEAETTALNAFSFLAQDDERLTRFLETTGLRPETIRQAVETPGFFAAVLDYVASDEPLLIDLAKALATKPERIMEARYTLSPSEFE